MEAVVATREPHFVIQSSAGGFKKPTTNSKTRSDENHLILNLEQLSLFIVVCFSGEFLIRFPETQIISME